MLPKNKSTKPSVYQHFIQQYFQIITYIIIGSLFIAGLVFGLLTFQKIFTSFAKQRQEKLTHQLLIGNIYYSESLLTDFSSDSLQNLFNSNFDEQLRLVGTAVIFDNQHLLTAAHLLNNHEGYYYFYNESLSWQPLTDWQIYRERDLAFGTFKDFKSVEKYSQYLKIASDLSLGESLQTWVKRGRQWQASYPVVSELSRMISLQQAWGEMQVASLSVVAVKASNRLGDSGSPVFNQAGELVGVLVGVDLEDETISYLSRL